jgi:hypothetical protein
VRLGVALPSVDTMLARLRAELDRVERRDGDRRFQNAGLDAQRR